MSKHHHNFTAEQVQALWESAEHWLENVTAALAAVDSGRLLGDVEGQVSLGYASCQCCHRWHPEYTRDSEKPCWGCPIAQYTGEPFCGNTPYGAAEYAYCRDDRDFAENAEREYRFLVCLALGDDPNV